MTRPELENKMAVLLGGRAAEQLTFGEISTGAADDIQKVTNIARSMVTRYGMAEKLGNVTYEAENQTFLGGPAPAGWHERTYSEATAREIDEVVKSIVDAAFARSLGILKSKRAILERGAKLLLEKETLVEDDLRALIAEDRAAAAQ
jgi:cell division protease FtsH